MPETLCTRCGRVRGDLRNKRRSALDECWSTERYQTGPCRKVELERLLERALPLLRDLSCKHGHGPDNSCPDASYCCDAADLVADIERTIHRGEPSPAAQLQGEPS